MEKVLLNKIPSSLYRIEFSSHFTLKKAIAIIPYLHQLGIEGIYASPLYEAASKNGYDVTNPQKLNPEIGSMEEFEAFCDLLASFKMLFIFDVVPNHMGFKEKKNHWWLDVLEKGVNSPYADFFDIDWNPPRSDLKNKILLPLLGKPYGKALQDGEIKLAWEEEKFWIHYGDYAFPISQESYPFILDGLSKKGASINKIVTLFNGEKGKEESFNLLHNLLERQWYRLSSWLIAGNEINYRRFFNINDLVAIHIEKMHVLQEHHEWIFQLLDKGKVQGLRVDHPDGLFDPQVYFERLQEHAPPLVVVEKILDYKEELPPSWKVQGTVGYEFISLLNGVFVYKNHEHAFDKIYEEFIGEKIPFDDLLYERKKWYIHFQMQSEIYALGCRIDNYCHASRISRDFSHFDIIEALGEIMACFPVYRTYRRKGEEVTSQDRAFIILAIERAKLKARDIETSTFDYLKDLFLLPPLPENEAGFDLILRFQQLTGPIMAKSLEDSTYYLYNRLISLNEVGNNPRHFGFSKAEFHEHNLHKLKHWPLGFLASSTHDTKYSEDVRMRLNVISEIPLKWREKVEEWRKENERFKQKINGVLFPEPNCEYYLYQMLMGIWADAPEGEEYELFLERIWKIFLKILRESGVHTNWRIPNPAYEKVCKEFFWRMLTPQENHQFLHSFKELERHISQCGMWNSLCALVLKMGSVGIVEIYQGNEDWKYSLVDPDNRQGIDYDLMQKKSLKRFITERSLHLRKQEKELFLMGEYIPLVIHGKRQENLIAFMRREEKKFAIIVASRFFSQYLEENEKSCWESFFEETVIALPKEFREGRMKEIFQEKEISISKRKGERVLDVGKLLSHYPFAIIVGFDDKEPPQ